MGRTQQNTDISLATKQASSDILFHIFLAVFATRDTLKLWGYSSHESSENILFSIEMKVDC